MTAQLLVIDDSATMRKLVEIAFRGSDCEIRFAGTGAEGLAQARSSPPHAVLVDFMLPDVKGLEVCKELAAHPATEGIRVVVMSGKPEIASLFRELPNVVGFLPKPFSPEGVRTRIDEALRRDGREPAQLARSRRATAEASSTSASQSVAGAQLHDPLSLQGRLEVVSLFEVLRLVLASGLAGVVRLDSGEHLYVADGSIVLCTTTRATEELDRLALRGGADLDVALSAARITQRQTAKPALVTLTEGGFSVEVDIAAALKAHGHRLLAAALACRGGRFTWQKQPLPDYVVTYGRPLAFLSIALEHARASARAPGSSAEVLDMVFRRAARFSESVAGLRLTNAERSVLAAVDGVTPVRALAERAKLSPQQVAATISHLSAVELIVRADGEAGTAATVAQPPILAHGLDAELVEQLRAVLARRPVAISVLHVADVADLDAAVSRGRPQLILIGADPGRLPPELRAIARLTAATLVAVLEMADDQQVASTLALGYDAVLLRPFHLTELERLLAL